MKQFPTSATDQHSLLMSAVNKSILIGDRDYREAKAVVAVARHSRKEDHCRYCAAWAAALYKTEALLAQVLGDR